MPEHHAPVCDASRVRSRGVARAHRPAAAHPPRARVYAVDHCPWAYDTDVNQLVIPPHDTDLACFCVMRCSFVITFGDDNFLDDAERASVGATWPDITMEIKFDALDGSDQATHLSLTQLNTILAEKLAWTPGHM